MIHRNTYIEEIEGETLVKSNNSEYYAVVSKDGIRLGDFSNNNANFWIGNDYPKGKKDIDILKKAIAEFDKQIQVM